jgi:hypothetical protein
MRFYRGCPLNKLIERGISWIARENTRNIALARSLEGLLQNSSEARRLTKTPDEQTSVHAMRPEHAGFFTAHGCGILLQSESCTKGILQRSSDQANPQQLRNNGSLRSAIRNRPGCGVLID